EALNKQHQERMSVYETQIGKARLEGYSDVFGSMADLSKVFAGKQSGIYRELFALEKSFHMASVIMNSTDAISKAWASASFPYNLPAVAVTAAKTGALQAVVSGVTMAGQAHDGIDSIPTSGTWNLEKGERIIDRRTNVDLKQYLNRQNTSRSGGGRPVQITQNLTIEAAPGTTPEQARHQGQAAAEAFKRSVDSWAIDASRPGGILYDLKSG